MMPAAAGPAAAAGRTVEALAGRKAAAHMELVACQVVEGFDQRSNGLAGGQMV